MKILMMLSERGCIILKAHLRQRKLTKYGERILPLFRKLSEREIPSVLMIFDMAKEVRQAPESEQEAMVAQMVRELEAKYPLKETRKS